MLKYFETILSIIPETLCITCYLRAMLNDGCIVLTKRFTISKINVYALIPKSAL